MGNTKTLQIPMEKDRSTVVVLMLQARSRAKFKHFEIFATNKFKKEWPHMVFSSRIGIDSFFESS